MENAVDLFVLMGIKRALWALWAIAEIYGLLTARHKLLKIGHLAKSFTLLTCAFAYVVAQGDASGFVLSETGEIAMAWIGFCGIWFPVFRIWHIYACTAEERNAGGETGFSTELHKVRESLFTDPLSTELELYKAFFTDAPLAAVVIDNEDRILIANNHLARIFGYTRDELISMKVTQLIPENKRNKHANLSALFIKEPKSIGKKNIVEVEVEGLRKDDRMVPVRLAISRITVRELTDRHYYGAGLLREVS